MMDLLLASHNRHKIQEFQRMFQETGLHTFRVRLASEAGLNEDPVEDGTTFEENALIKAAYPAMNGWIGMSDDSGLSVDYLHGEPGVHSARYAGEHGDDEGNNQKLLRELTGVPREKRNAKYVCVIAVVWPKNANVILPSQVDASGFLPARLRGLVGPCLVVRGECHGVLLEEYHGTGGFGYDPLFFIPEKKMTFAEMPMEEKNAMSHRGKALSQLTDLLKTI